MKKVFNRLMFKIGYVPVKTQVVNYKIESFPRVIVNIDIEQDFGRVTKDMKEMMVKILKD